MEVLRIVTRHSQRPGVGNLFSDTITHYITIRLRMTLCSFVMPLYLNILLTSV